MRDLFIVISAIIVVFTLMFLGLNRSDNKRNQPADEKREALIKQRLSDMNLQLEKLDTNDTLSKLMFVNDFFNELQYSTDWVTWNKEDYWASRKEFLGVGQGDCEDYAIAKYITLRQLGFTNKQIFLTYVRAAQTRMPHIVLTFYETPKSMPLVLDSINPKVLPANRRRDLKPIFNFNGDRIYMAKQRGLGRELPQGKIDLEKWTELMDKVEEGK